MAQGGTPLIGVQLVAMLDRDEIDSALGSYIRGGQEEVYSLDIDGKLVGASFWPNSRGVNGSRWLMGIRQGKVWLEKPVAVVVPAGLPVELTTLLTSAKRFPSTDTYSLV